MSRLTSLFESVTYAQPEKVPSDRPQELDDFKQLLVGRREEVARGLFSRDYILGYLDSKWKAELHNRDALINLVMYRAETTDEKQLHAIEIKIQTFLQAIGTQEKAFPALRLDLKKLGVFKKELVAAWGGEE